MNRDYWIMTGFGFLSVGMLTFIFFKRRSEVREMVSLAVYADFFSTIANRIGIACGFWTHDVRLLPRLFVTSVVYDMLFFPSTIVLYLVLMPQRRSWKWVYSLLWAGVLSVLEYWLETTSHLIHYHRGWNAYKTFLLYLLTYFIFYWVYRWLLRRSPGAPK